MTEFEFDRDAATKNATFATKVFGIKGDYYFNAGLGYLYSGKSDESVGPFTTKARAQEAIDALLSVLNHPEEIKARVDKAEAVSRATHEAYASAHRRRTRGLFKTIREAVKQSGEELRDGDVLIAQYNPGMWRGDARWFDVTVEKGKLTCEDTWGEEAKTVAIREAKENHTGRVALIVDDAVVWQRKGEKVEREHEHVARVYHAERKTYRSQLTRTRMVRVDDEGEVVSPSHRFRGRKQVTGSPVEFATVDEARAWIAAHKTEGPLVWDWVQKIVKVSA